MTARTQSTVDKLRGTSGAPLAVVSSLAALILLLCLPANASVVYSFSVQTGTFQGGREPSAPIVNFGLFFTVTEPAFGGFSDVECTDELFIGSCYYYGSAAAGLTQATVSLLADGQIFLDGDGQGGYLFPSEQNSEACCGSQPVTPFDANSPPPTGPYFPTNEDGSWFYSISDFEGCEFAPKCTFEDGSLQISGTPTPEPSFRAFGAISLGIMLTVARTRRTPRSMTAATGELTGRPRTR